MQNKTLHNWQHSHSFNQDIKRPGEIRTLIVIAITFFMMIIEIAAGILYGSMALLADGLHMASHTVALGINAFAYVYARRQAHNNLFSFGTGKVNTLGGYTGAILLAGFAMIMVWESTLRFISPQAIQYNQAIFVAIFGLIVNGASVFILGHQSHSDDHHEHGHAHHDHDHSHGHDHNLVSAYLHVLADALTSILAIFALLAAKYLGLIWADPAMGILGAILVMRWSVGLLASTSKILLDHEAADDIRDSIRRTVEAQDGNRVSDLHIWAVGPGIYSAIISIVTQYPQPPEHYKKMIPPDIGVVHIAVEVHLCDEHGMPCVTQP
jgi:cation diffusion facilitator family transporter